MKWLLYFAFCSLPLFLHSQVPLGSGLTDDAPGSWYGYDVDLSADGRRLVVGAPRTEEGGEEQGVVWVYDFTNGDWEAVGSPISSPAARIQGYSVSLSADGNRLAVGAIVTEPGGSVMVYEYNGAAWGLIAHLYGESEAEWFGHDVALSADGQSLAVGSYRDDTVAEDCGKLTVFKEAGGQWVPVGAPIYGTEDQHLGASVALSEDGTILAAGAPGRWSSAPTEGNVLTFRLENGGWQQFGSTIYGDWSNDGFGAAIALSDNGDYIVISAKGQTGVDDNFVEVYSLDGPFWQRVGPKIKSPGLEGSSFFGHALAMDYSGSRIVVGDPYYLYQWESNGSAYVFTRENDQYQLSHSIYARSPDEGFGWSVALSADGETLAAGATKLNDEADHMPDGAFVYELSGVPATADAGLAGASRRISVHPNPGTIFFRPELTAAETVRLHIRNSSGRLLGEADLSSGEYYDSSWLPSGFYLLEWYDEQMQPMGRSKWLKQ